MSDAISLSNVSKLYKIPSIYPWRSTKVISALKNATMTCPDNKITSLLGPNGAGKTTIIKILAGLILPDSGNIEIFNKPFINTTVMQQNKIGLVTPNDRSFYWRLTGRQNLDFFGSLFGLKGKKRKQVVSEILNEVDLLKEADKPFRLYSAGMRQKLLFARALLGNPEILLLDEPTTHIDPIAKDSIHRLIKENFSEKRQTTILLCTHDLMEAQKLAQKIILIDNGSVIASGTMSSLRSMISPSIRILIEFSKNPIDGWEDALPIDIVCREDSAIEFIVPDEDIISKTIEAAISGGGKILSCQRLEEPLFEIFSRLTSRAAS
ncbi:MAG: ABC transporter ATP-binding protein [Spirochaetota bacterium]|nr:ABC transporter ATP-binding protein [Spirochaetota bacterium]